MSAFRFTYPLQIRYGDLDPQWHVNNAHTVTLIETGRSAYLVHLGLWDGQDFNALGLIVADVHVSYLAPITLQQKVQVGVRVARLGHKSLTFKYAVEDCVTGKLLAAAETIMVSFDYNSHQSMPVPEEWREKIKAFEGDTLES
jgi:acyl-CoA thioester hydrolase